MPTLRITSSTGPLRKGCIFAALAFLCAPALVFAGLQESLTRPGSGVLLTGSNPTLEPAELRQATRFQDQLFFLKYGQLWRSGGTAEQTAVVSEVEGYNSIEKLLATDDHLFLFHPLDGLWVSEGTTQSTRRLTQPRVFSEALLASDSNLYLWKDVAEIWAADGVGQPQLVHAFPEGSRFLEAHTEGSSICFLLNIDTAAPFFQREVWCTDGVSGLTKIEGPDGDWDYADQVAVFGEQVLVWDGGLGDPAVLVWSTPSSGIGPPALLISYAPASSGGRGSIRFGSDLYFFAAWEIWRTDGTPGGTALAVSLPPLSVWDNAYFVGATDSKLFFEYNRSSPNGGYFSSNGTAGGTGLILATAGQITTAATVDSEFLYFSITGSYARATGNLRGSSETGLWRSDGTFQGTERIGPRTGPAFPISEHLLQIDDSHGGGLWKIDARDTELVTGTIPLGRADFTTLWQWVGAPTGDRAVATTGGTEIWGTDGTAEGTEVLRQGGTIGTPRSVGQVAVFSSGVEMLRSAGTPAGTSTIGNGSSSESAPSGSLLYYWWGDEIWQTDGSLTGTLLRVNLAAQYVKGGLRVIGDRALFYDAANLWALGDEPGDPSELLAGPLGGIEELQRAGAPPRDTYLFRTSGDVWSSDGTTAGTGYIGPGVGARSAVYLDDTDVIYLAQDVDQEETWLADGTLDGAELVPGGPQPLAQAGMPGVAITYSDEAGEELWSIPGNWEDAVPLELEEGPGHAVYFRTATVPLDGYLYFAGYRRDTGVELFRTDGTSTPELVVDLNPGPASGVQKAITTVPGKIIVAADDGATGLELWAIQVGPVEFFEDGFESGDTTAWTSTSP